MSCVTFSTQLSLITLLLLGACGQSHQHQRKRQLHDYRKLQVAQKQLAASETANTPECSADYGEQYVQRWHNLQDVYCNTSHESAATVEASASKIHCHAHPEADISTCMGRNVVLQGSSAFMGQKGGIPGLPNPSTGSIQLACNRTAEPKVFLRGRLQSNEGSRMWLVKAPVFGISPAQQWQSCKPGHAIQHPVLFLMRVDTENAFHNLETVVSVFAALATLQLPPQLYFGGMEVVIADDRPLGYFSSIWARLSHPHPVRFLRQQPFPDGACFATALIAPYTAHTQSLLTYRAGAADEVLCESAVLQATSLWLRHLFRDLLPVLRTAGSTYSNTLAGALFDGGFEGSNDSGTRASDRPTDSSSAGDSMTVITAEAGSASWRSVWYHYGSAAAADVAPLQPSPPQSQLQLQQLHVLWLSRRRFERQREQQLTGWQRARQISMQQQEQLLVELQRAVLRWNEQTCVHDEERNCSTRSVVFSLQVAELSDLPFYPDQISLFMRTGVLVGIHGAGLSNQIFMPPRLGAVVEVWHNMENNYHYHNLAHMLGHKYFNVHCEDDLDVQQIIQKAEQAMNAVVAARSAAEKFGKVSWWRKHWNG